MRAVLQILSFAAALTLFWWLGNPHEMKHNRVPKMLGSLPFLTVIIFIGPLGLSRVGGYSLIFSLCALGFIWASNVSWRLAGALTGLFHGDATSETGIYPNYRFAKNHRRDGEYEQAIKATQHELEKDPKNYEGLILMAGIYYDLKMPANAVTHLSIILNNPEASESQKEGAKSAKSECEQLQKELDLIAATKKRNP